MTQHPSMGEEEYLQPQEPLPPVLHARSCSGAPSPCNSCQEQGRTCQFNPDQDRRRKVTQKRLQDFQTQVIEVIRFSERETVDNLVQFIRTHPPIDRIEDYIKDLHGDLANNMQATMDPGNFLDHGNN
ncbi:hypothetical protein N7495_003968 [Penicillium taxi]|uniref:uncharacterized protein n=1 Tax=Penicillium taxi TaxID=168475 RepID=UPI002544DF10|nr:uncharacterized protein N7495_003968 [Penicillium taxi]KAJ5899224.1 hypothetical protein N7495_003968 [Penicillium taxi]